MKHDKVFKREDGTRIKITAVFSESRYSTPFFWDFEVAFCKPGKRTWGRTYHTDDWSFRKLNLDERLAFIKEQDFKLVTSEEVRATQLELWEQMKPQA